MVPNPLVVLALISCLVLHAVQVSVTVRKHRFFFFLVKLNLAELKALISSIYRHLTGRIVGTWLLQGVKIVKVCVYV